jgi:hypothetical protein
MSSHQSSKGRDSRPANFEDRYRLYIDESGDHVFREITELYACWAAGFVTPNKGTAACYAPKK